MDIPERLLFNMKNLEKLLMRELRPDEQEIYIKAWLEAYDDLLDGKTGGDSSGGMAAGLSDWTISIIDWAKEAVQHVLPSRDEMEKHARKKRLAKQAEAARARLRSRSKGSWNFKPRNGPR